MLTNEQYQFVSIEKNSFEVSMKKQGLLLAILASISIQVQAQGQCNLDIQNEVHLDGDQVEIYQQDAPQVLIDKDNNVFINGEKLDLDSIQRDAVDQYRQNMNEYLPKAKEIAKDGLALAKSILDDISTSFDNSEAFNNVKQALEEFFNSLEQRYQKGDEFVLQEAAFGDAMTNWKEDFAAAKETFNAEFFSSAFDAMAEQMKQEGGLNLTELKNKMVELQANLDSKLKSESTEIKQDAQQYCDDLEKVAEEEKMLHEKIPELKDYKVFLI